MNYFFFHFKLGLKLHLIKTLFKVKLICITCIWFPGVKGEFARLRVKCMHAFTHTIVAERHTSWASGQRRFRRCGQVPTVRVYCRRGQASSCTVSLLRATRLPSRRFMYSHLITNHNYLEGAIDTSYRPSLSRTFERVLVFMQQHSSPSFLLLLQTNRRTTETCAES